MDKPPSNFYNKFSQIKKVLSGIFFTAIFVSIFFSCANTAPDISSINAKVVYDFENDKDKPVQKLTIFLEMKSEIRRIEQINIYHKKTGYRWIIKDPLLFETNSKQFAGYTNCQVAGILNDIPEGEYQVCYLDSQGRETFNTFLISKNEYSTKNLLKFKKDFSPEDYKLMLAVYDEESKLISYSVPEAKFEISKENMTYNGDSIFKTYSKASFFRLIYEGSEKIFIMPKVFKAEKKADNKETKD